MKSVCHRIHCYTIALLVACLIISAGVMDDSDQYMSCIHSVITATLTKMTPLWMWIDRRVQSLHTRKRPRHEFSPWKWTRTRSIRYKLIALTVIAHAATKPTERVTLFDTDSQVVGVDNRCTACMSHISEDFIPGTLKPTTRVTIKGFGGARVSGNISVGTLHWKFCDDQGVKHHFKIPNSYFVPEGGMRLLSPQHWARTQKDPDRLGTGAWTGASQVTLYWKGRAHCRTIPLDIQSNVADLHLAPGYLGYDRFCKSQSVDPETLPADTPFVADPAIIPPDDEDDVPAQVNPKDFSDEWQTEISAPRMFNLSGPSTLEERKQAPMVITDEEDRVEESSTFAAELLRYHQMFGHLPFAKLQEMAKKGIIPKWLAKCKHPFCSACAYAKATRRPW